MDKKNNHRQYTFLKTVTQKTYQSALELRMWYKDRMLYHRRTGYQKKKNAVFDLDIKNI